MTKSRMNWIGLAALACVALPGVASAEAGYYSFELKNTCVDDNVTVSVFTPYNKEQEGKTEVVAKLSAAQNTYTNLDAFIPAKDVDVTVQIQQTNIAGPWCSNFFFTRTAPNADIKTGVKEVLYLQEDGRLGKTKTEIKRSGGMLVGVQSDFQILVNRATGAVQVKSR